MFKGENKNINISVSKNSPVNASLSLDGYKHSMVQIIALTIALKMKTVIVNPPIVSDTYVFIAIQLAKDDYNKAIEAHESGSHVEVIGEIEDNGKRKKLMTAESFSIID